MRDLLVMVGLAAFVAWYGILRLGGPLFVDAKAYWSVDALRPYAGDLGQAGVFAYSPPLAVVFGLLGHIPEPVFLAAWLAINLAVLAWLARPWPPILAILAVPIADELLSGQIELLLTAAIVLGLRRPALWALPLLAKATTGVGLAWFAMRREWGSLAVALAATALVVALSWLVEPTWWPDWLAFVGRTPGNLALPLRLAAALAFVVWGARTDRRWTVVATATLALPVVYVHSLAMLVGVSYLKSNDRYPSNPTES
ncbi:MAG: DUF2029 domain-containing protein [Chloroflexi bacterium]|nr:DUF2029 domain-containing protein [Chloroflexota bacterium]